MKIGQYKMANEWMREESATPEEALNTWNELEAEFKANRAMSQEPRSMDQAALVDELVPGPLKDEMLGKFNPDQETYEDYLQRINLERPFNMAEGGQLVAPSVDGSRPGYAGKKVEDNIRLRDNGNAYDVEVKRGGETFRQSFNLKDYKNKTEALEAAKKFKTEKIKIPFKTGKQDPMFGSGLDKKEYQKLYHAKTRTLTEAGELAKERDLKLKNFIGNKKKINASTLRDFVIDDLGYDNYSAGKIKQKFPNLEIIKDIKTGTKFTPLTKKQIELVKDNFDLPEGVEKWNFKQYKNGISADKYPNLFAQIKRRLDDKNVYKVAANFSDPQGWMMGSMNRVYENETILKEDGTRVLKKGVKKLTYEPKFNKKGIIVGFKDNTAAGKNNIYYGTKKAEKNYGDGTDWRIHGNFNRVDKFLKIANGVKAEPDKLLQKILDKKGITQILGGKGYLTLNDILSHKRYYSTLAKTSPKALIKRQIVLHHTGGVGDQNLARAAATKDIQLLTDVVNSNVIKLENIVKGTPNNPARKLKADEIAQLKNYGAKILDFDGKVVGGGFIDPDRQFAAIEKDALKYAKGKDFNVKTVASYLERLGCGRAAGGRILFAEGVPSLTKCAQKGVTKLENGLKNGFKNADDAVLARGILKAGRGLKDVVSLRGLFGPAALAFTAAAEAGIVGYNMLSTGKSFREAVGESVFNSLLGDKTKIDLVEERNKRMKEEGMTPEQMGKLGAMESAFDDLGMYGSQFNKLAAIQKNRDAISMSPEDAFNEGAFQLDLDRQEDEARENIQDFYRSGAQQRVGSVDYAGGFENLAEGLARNEFAQLQSVDNPLQSRKGDEKRAARMNELMLQYPDLAPEYDIMEGGIARLNVNKK